MIKIYKKITLLLLLYMNMVINLLSAFFKLLLKFHQSDNTNLFWIATKKKKTKRDTLNLVYGKISLRNLYSDFCMVLYCFVSRETCQVSLVEQELLILPEHMSSPPIFSGVRVCPLVFCVAPIVLFSFGNYVVCSSSIYRFLLPFWYLRTLLVIEERPLSVGFNRDRTPN